MSAVPYLARRCATLATMAAIVMLFVFSAKSWGQGANGGGDLAGSWQGSLGGALRIVLTIEKEADGTYKGMLNSVDQGAVLPMSNIALKDGVFHFEIAQVGGTFEGKMNADGTTIAGTWTQTGVPSQPLSFTRQAQTAAATPAQGAKSAAPGPTPKPITAPLDVSIPFAPRAFKADGKWQLAYELHITNLAGADCELTSIEAVSDGVTEKSLVKLAGVDLTPAIMHPGQKGEDASRIPGGAVAIVYMWATVASRDDVPAAIRHKIVLKVGSFPDEITLETPPSPVNREPVVIISSPLSGDGWLAGNGPSNTSGHRRALIPVDGHAYISQRYAIDWVQLNPSGTTFQGDRLDNKNYRDYGTEVHSVADGVVTEVKDGIPQNTPGASSRAVPITLETIGGNHVIVKIADGVYAGYMHMQPGSIRVKVGDKVTRGQVLGLLGNSGNSTEPHLHFQLCTANSTLGCEGVPYAFASFEVEGKGWGWKASDSHEAPVEHQMEMPTEGEVVNFSARPTK